ncbi:MAG: hypothetical protein ACJAV9_000975 [Urechidicola sp.]|jgi:hypothetical protein
MLSFLRKLESKRIYFRFFVSYRMTKQNIKEHMKNLFLILIVILTSASIFAQEKTGKETLTTDEIIVVKPYVPKISYAFKLKENPSLEDEDIPKDSVNYTINSIPVASTFTPTKGKAQSVVRERLKKIYENYIAVGFGNYTTPYLEAFLHSSSARNNDYGAFIKHKSSKGGIKDVLLGDNFSDTQVELYFKQFERDYNWEINAGAKHLIYNWYGLPKDQMFTDTFIDGLNEKQRYINVFAGGKLHFEDGFFKGGKVSLNQFSDDFNSGEIHLLIAPKIEFPISSELINIEASLEFIGGKFSNTYTTDDDIKYTFLKVGVSPSFEVLRDDLTVNLGAKVYYSFDLESKVNKLFTYPNVTASYKLVEETLITFAGITGDLIQNSYRETVYENPFVSPTLNILQTDNQYNAFLGIKGQLSSNVSYNFKASYQNEKNKPLFISNPSLTNGLFQPTFGYQVENSFGLIYDNIETMSVEAELNVNLSKEFQFTGKLEFNNYTTTAQEEAWNLPTIKSTVTLDYHNQKWYGGANLFFTGKRFDFITPYNGIGQSLELDSYVDLNLKGGYVFTDRLTAFAKINNVLSSNYQPFHNYDVQGIQVLAGIIYKFDF